jgi:hypothetical protein
VTIVSSNSCQYCPFCGEKLVLPELFHFCPHCGKKLSNKERKQKKKLKKIKIAMTDVADSVGTVVNLSTEGHKMPDKNSNENSKLAEPIVTQQTNVLQVPSGACTLGEPLLNSNDTERAAFLPALPDGIYTVILKSCPDKERLFIRLTEILRRDSFAIRLAVELIPTVLMYKNKLAEVLPVIQVCRAEGAVCAIVSGDLLTATVNFPQAVLAELSGSEQDLITNSPPILWLGETIYFAVGKVMSQGKQGLLILSNHHLYFVFTGQKRFEYAMIPLATVVSVESAERKNFTTLIVRQQEQTIETFYVTSQQRGIAKLQQLLQTVVTAQQSRQESPVH